jgi:hypothetical protein
MNTFDVLFDMIHAGSCINTGNQLMHALLKIHTSADALHVSTFTLQSIMSKPATFYRTKQ